MNRNPFRKPALALAAVFLASVLSACGGGGSDAPSTTTTVTGTVFASPVSGAAVTVRNAAGSIVAGPATTAPTGAFSVAVPNASLAGALRFECAGGTFTDEATNASAAGGRMAAYAEAGSLAAGSAIHLTPMSTLTHDLVVESGLTPAAARAACTSAFGFCDNTSIGPVNDNVVPGSDNVARRLCALRAAAFSRLALDLGLPADNQFALIDALASDLSDNVLNGRNGAGVVNMAPGVPLPEDVQNRFGGAFAAMWASAGNRTGLTADQIGSPAFAKVALTNTYRVEYVPGAMGPVQGRTDFRLRVTRRSDNTAVTGLDAGGLRLVPWMYMATKSHSSPIDNAIVETATPGEYACTVYYLMSTNMGSVSMGFWELRALVNGETATFHPTVGMPMGEVTRVVLKGTNDNAASSPVAPRSYFLFKDGAVTGSAGNHIFNVYVAAYDNQSTYPQLQVGTVLRDPSGTPWTVDNVALQASTDNTFAIGVVDGVNGSGAHWSFPGLAGLTAGTGRTVYVKLFVNGEQKTTDGFAASASNGFGTFTVTAP